MNQTSPVNHARPAREQGIGVIRTILVVDDSRAQRKLLTHTLTRQGYDVFDAEDGLSALELCRETEFDLVLSDWMMPGMDGLEFCRAFRELERESYGYFILLTSKTEKGAVARGLDVGADDFLNKPVNGDELRARISAGERMLRMEREVSETLAELQRVYDKLDQDLVNARKIQLALLPETHADYTTGDVSLMLKPSGHVGGDLVGYFSAGTDRLAVYSIDVSGHGVASALLTARLSSYLADAVPGQNIALREVAENLYSGRPPTEVAEALNALLVADEGTDLYFTIVFGYLDLRQGTFDYVQCGHPNPLVIAADGSVRYIGEGGLPIGLLDDAWFTQHQVLLEPGDRILLYSDGFPECMNSEGEMLDDDGFLRLVREHADLDGSDLFDAMVWQLDLFSGAQDFGDDLSCALVRFKGPVAKS